MHLSVEEVFLAIFFKTKVEKLGECDFIQKILKKI